LRLHDGWITLVGGESILLIPVRGGMYILQGYLTTKLKGVVKGYVKSLKKWGVSGTYMLLFPMDTSPLVNDIIYYRFRMGKQWRDYKK
jgi:hypothetical protein